MSNQKEIRRLYKIIRENLKEFNDLKNVKSLEEVESIYRWCSWIRKDCYDLLNLKIPKKFNSVEEYNNRDDAIK